MNRKWLALTVLVCLLLTGCTGVGADSMYALPKRPEAHRELQQALDLAMNGLEYSAPRSGENLQPVQKADLNGDGAPEYLLFARETGSNLLQVKIFQSAEDGYALRETINCTGTSFDQVEYVDMDGNPGLELIVGTQLSDQVLRSVSVYSFSDGSSVQLMTSNYTKFLTCDLDRDSLCELLVLRSGESEETNGVALYFACRDGEVVRSTEIPMSRPAENMKRIMVSKLADGRPAVYVASAVDETSIITDVFAIVNKKFTNVSLSTDSGTSVQTLRSYFVYADDLDLDGVMELPELITMKPLGQAAVRTDVQHLIRWYAMVSSGIKVYKMSTFHNFDAGWYLQLDNELASRMTVTQNGGAYSFYLWNENDETVELFMTIHTFTGQDREELAATGDRFLLYRTDSVVYAAEMNPSLVSDTANPEIMKSGFHLIRQAWKTGET